VVRKPPLLFTSLVCYFRLLNVFKFSTVVIC